MKPVPTKKPATLRELTTAECEHVTAAGMGRGFLGTNEA